MKRHFGLSSILIAASGILQSVPAFASNPTVTPEPATWILLGSGLAGYAAYRWFRSR